MPRRILSYTAKKGVNVGGRPTNQLICRDGRQSWPELGQAEPLDDTPPVVVGNTVVSFWTYYPQPVGPSPTSAHLGRLLRDLHDLPPPAVPLPNWVPLESLTATVWSTDPGRAFSGKEKRWLLDRIDGVRSELADQTWPLGTGLIHGDAWAGNLLWDLGSGSAQARLGDWDWAAIGPREVDLIPTWHAMHRYGRDDQWVKQFSEAYGYDLATWSGFPRLLTMRDLVQLTGPLHRLNSPSYAATFRQRLTAIRTGDPAAWTAR